MGQLFSAPQVFSVPDEEWIEYIAQMLLLGHRISEELIGQEMDGSLADMERIQRILDSNQIPATNTQELQSLGIVFGTVFINETPGYDWWVVEDEYGKDVCIRYRESSLLVFPQTIISKRIEDGEEIDIMELFTGIRKLLDDMIAEGDYV